MDRGAQRHPRSKVGALLVPLALVAGSLTAVLIEASATPAAQVVRLGGPDRIATSVLVSSDAFAAGQAAAAVVARSDDYPDALAGTPLAAARNGPLLLTSPKGLDPRVASELQRAVPAGRTVYLLGGTAALSSSVSDAIAALGYQIVRYGGGDRYETAAVIADAGLANPPVLFLATGTNFPDALVGGAAASRTGGAVLLTDGPTLPATTGGYLQAHPAAVRHAIGAAAGAATTTDQFVGSDRYDTARLVAEHFFSSPTVVGVASGTSFADAMSGGAHIAHLGGPLVLSAPPALSAAAERYLSANEPTIVRGYLYGGTVALSSFTEDGVRAALTGSPPPTTTTSPPGPATHFGTLPPGSALPDDATCAGHLKPVPENRPGNATYNATSGTQKNMTGPYPLFGRVDGAFTGTTDEIIQWTACKWGIDEDLVRAQAAVESWWNQTNVGDFASDPSTCVPNHPIGADGVAGQCPNTIGLLSVRYSESHDAFPESETSTAYNADYTYAYWRACYEGLETWLNTVDRNGTYGPGDVWGCMGVWFSGRWHTPAADGYIGKVQSYFNQRIWAQPQFAG